MSSDPSPRDRDGSGKIVAVNDPAARPIDWRAAGRGAALGLTVIVPITIARTIVDRRVDHFNDTGWAVLFAVAILVPLFVAGVGAGRWAPAAPLSNGMVAAVGALVLWIPVRVVIWAVRESGRGLVSGSTPALPIGQLFVTAVFAAGLGALGGLVGARSAARRDNGTGGESAGRPRAGFDPSEERPDSAGQGAG